MFRRLGPGILVAAAFVGPGTLTVCTVAGVRFGYTLLWALTLSIIATVVLQGMASRVGLVAQEGLAAVVKRTLKHTWLKYMVILIILGAILVGNAAYEAGNIGGASLGMEQLVQNKAVTKWSPLLIGFLAFVLLWFGTYKILEKVFMALVGIMGLSFLICAVMAKPSLGLILKGALIPQFSGESLLTVVALVGTTVVPYNLFLHASLVNQKWKSISDLKAVKWDTLISIVLGGLVSMAILITASAAPIQQVNNAADMATGLEPLFGRTATYMMSIGLLAAGITSAITAPLAAAFVANSCFGWNTDMQDRRFKLVWGSVLFFGVFFLFFDINPIEVIQFAQVANGILLPVMAILLLWMVNQKSVMGQFRNNYIQNILGVIIVGFTVFLGFKSIFKVMGLF